jgi:putative ABC transport system permease protein
MPCTVVGVLAGRGQTSGSIDDDNIVAMPIDAYLRRIQGSQDIPAIVLSASPAAIDRVKLRVERLMRERRELVPGQPDDFTVLDSRQLADAMRATGGAVRLMLGAVAAIGLLIGAIGIMNMMLISVTERTREIGIRIAIGALPWQVLVQFMTEAVLLAVAGGAVGAVLGVAVAAMCSRMLGIALVVDFSMLALALAVSVLVGLVSGLAPATRAARLRPVDALRHSC